MKYISAAIFVLFFSTFIYASHLQNATVINNTGTNIQIVYLVCEGNNCDGGAHRLFLDEIGESSRFYGNLNPGQNIRVLFAEEIDKIGASVPNGARGLFDSDCKANTGQILRLIQGTAPRTKGTIFCQVE